MPELETPALVVDTQTVATPVVAADDSAARLTILEKELKEARGEAAKYRTTLRTQETAQAAADAASLVEQGKFKELFEKEQAARTALEAQVAQATHGQAQLAAAIAAGLAPAMASRLVGSTPEELAADAKTLAEHFKVAPPATGPTNPPAQRGQPSAVAFDPKNPPKLSSIAWKV